MSVSTRLRFEILKRDRFRCRYCGADGDEAALHVDHVVPIAKGGTDDPENLLCACERCNLGKSDVELTVSMVDGYSTIERPLTESVEETLAEQARMERALDDAVDQLSDDWGAAQGYVSPAWQSVVRSHLRSGTHGMGEIRAAIDAVAAKKRRTPDFHWRSRERYFGGVLRTMRKRRSEALRALEADLEGGR